MSEIPTVKQEPKKILRHPNPILSAKNEPIDFENSTTEERIHLVIEMGNALYSQPWGSHLGIAAPQIGVNKKACLIAGIPMFNPVFVPPSYDAIMQVTEGCYSFPEGELYSVRRSKYGWVKWYDVDGNYHDEKFTGIKALVAQHEISHLDGKCCGDLGVCVQKAPEIFIPEEIKAVVDKVQKKSTKKPSKKKI